MKKKPKKTYRFEEVPLNTACPFCKSKKEPDYKDPVSLSKFMSDRARILSRERSGVCAKHQRRLSLAIKRARHLALLPYVPQV